MSSPANSDVHQVGITNAQENNPDVEIARLTSEMNALFAAKQYSEAARLALLITAQSKEELRETFERHEVRVIRLDHEAFGIYGIIEPSYDVLVDGHTSKVLEAAMEFGKRHAQQAVLVVRKLREGESETAGRMGLLITLNDQLTVEVAVRITDLARLQGFAGATFAPKRQGSLSIYHTDDLGMTSDQFQDAATSLLGLLIQEFPALTFMVDQFLIQMPSL